MKYEALASIRTTVAAKVVEIVDGGQGYKVEDELTAVGGTGTAAILNVTSVSSVLESGVITGAKITSGGAYSVCPTSPSFVSGGSGSGATFNIVWKGRCVDVKPGEVIPEDCECPNPDAWIRHGLIKKAPAGASPPRKKPVRAASPRKKPQRAAKPSARLRVSQLVLTSVKGETEGDKNKSKKPTDDKEPPEVSKG